MDALKLIITILQLLCGIAIIPEFATYEMRNPKPGKGLGCFMA